MKRFYYISDDLDDLEQIEHDLEAGGIPRHTNLFAQQRRRRP